MSTGEDEKTVDLSGGVKRGGSGKARGGACGVKLEKTRFHACGATRACLGERRCVERGETGLINRVKGGGTCRHHRHEISMLFCGTEGSLLVQS
ncbi:unnamed protein product, partial [Brassica rapa subsp. trilocularis]